MNSKYVLGINTYPRCNKFKFKKLLTSLLLKPNIQKDFIKKIDNNVLEFTQFLMKLNVSALKSYTNIELNQIINDYLKFKIGLINSSKYLMFIKNSDETYRVKIIFNQDKFEDPKDKDIKEKPKKVMPEIYEYHTFETIEHYNFPNECNIHTEYIIGDDTCQNQEQVILSLFDSYKVIQEYQNLQDDTLTNMINSMLQKGFKFVDTKDIDIEFIIDGIKSYAKNSDMFKNRISRLDYPKLAIDSNKPYSDYLNNLDPIKLTDFENKITHEHENGLSELVSIINDFKDIYAGNVTICGTKYHCNLPINRNIFMSKHQNDYKMFCDDDDLSANLDFKLYNFNLYKRTMYDIYTNMKTMKYIHQYEDIYKIKTPDDYIEFRKQLYQLSKQHNENISFKFNMLDCYCLMSHINYDNDKIIKYENDTSKNNNLNFCMGFWSIIIPPYEIDPFTSIQEVSKEDIVFSQKYTKNTLKNCLYNYIYTGANENEYSRTQIDYNRLLYTEQIKRYCNTHTKSEKFNKGDFYYLFDSVVEWINSNNVESNEFVSDRLFRKIKIEEIDVDEWNDKLSNDDILNTH